MACGLGTGWEVEGDPHSVVYWTWSILFDEDELLLLLAN